MACDLGSWAIRSVRGHHFDVRKGNCSGLFDLTSHAHLLGRNLYGMFHITRRKHVHSILARGIAPGKIASPLGGITEFVECGNFPPWDDRDVVLWASFKNVDYSPNDPDELVVVEIATGITRTQNMYVAGNGVMCFEFVNRCHIIAMWTLRRQGSMRWEAAQLLYSSRLPHLVMTPTPDWKFSPARDLQYLRVRNHMCDVVADVVGFQKRAQVPPEVEPSHLLPLGRHEL